MTIALRPSEAEMASGRRRRPRTLLLVIASLAPGGAERVLSVLASAWAERGDRVHLATMDGGDRAPFYPLHAEVRLHRLDCEAPSAGASQAIAQNAGRCWRVRRLMRLTRPDCVLAFGETASVVTLLAGRGLGIPIVVSERTDPSQYPVGAAWSWLRRLSYPWAREVVFQTASARDGFGSHLPRAARVVPNPVLALQPNSQPEFVLPRPLVLAMGSLNACKGFDLLLQAFALLPPAAANWQLAIFGEGPLRSQLEAQRDQLGLEGRVQFPGLCRNSADVMAQADVFVLSSRFEGFPNVLCEAMAAGCACIASNCRSGPSDIMEDGRDGMLIRPEDPVAMARALWALMRAPERRRELGEQARSIGRRLALERILGLWDEILPA